MPSTNSSRHTKPQHLEHLGLKIDDVTKKNRSMGTQTRQFKGMPTPPSKKGRPSDTCAFFLIVSLRTDHGVKENQIITRNEGCVRKGNVSERSHAGEDAAAALHGESVLRMILEWRYSGYIRINYDDGGHNSYDWYQGVLGVLGCISYIRGY